MNQTLAHINQAHDLKNLSLVAWRIRQTRAKIHEKQVHRQIMEQQHGADRPN